MTITETTTVADIAAGVPSSVRVFQRHNIDFCCGGKRPLGEVCRERGLSFDALAGEVEAAAAGAADPGRDWTVEPLDALIAHIVSTYHDALREELPRLEMMATKVARVHGGKDTRLGRVSEVVTDLAADLQAHMWKEERVLFPAIAAIETGAGAPPMPIDAPISVMEHEHDRAGTLLAELRTLTDGHTPPAWGCATLRALFHGLSELESSMHVHVHLENNVLFPRALHVTHAPVGG